VVWVVGDETIDGSETGTSFKQVLFFKEIGFKLHDTMIYEKNSAPNPSLNRYEQVFEYMFVLSKDKPKTTNLIKDKKNRWAGTKTFGTTSRRQKDGSLTQTKKELIAEFGNRNNIFKYSNGYGYTTADEIAYEHPAIFPEKLAADHIYTWSNENDIVYDCFGGSGTTAKMAHIYKRNWIISEMSAEFCKLAQKRIQPYLNQTTLNFTP